MKKGITALLFTGCSLLFAQIRLGILNGPSCIPSAYLLDNVLSVEGEELETENFASAQTLTAKLLKDEIDIGFLPPNVAAICYNSNGGVICTAITGTGNLSLITKNSAVKKLSDLNGKTVYVAGAGATPEYMFRYLLKKNKIQQDSKDGVSLDFSIPTQQLAAMLISGKIEYAVVPEPFATVACMKDPEIIKAIDLQTEYEKLEGPNQTYPLTVMVVSKKFAHNKTVTLNKFLQLYEESYEWTMDNGLDAGFLCEQLDLGLKANVVSNSIPYANYTFIPGRDGKKQLEKLFKIFSDNDPKSIGGKLPDKNFYY